MMDIRPVSDLRNKYPEIEKAVQANGHVFLTKNGYGSMVVISIEEYSRLVNNVELALDEADKAAKSSSKRLSHREAFSHFKKIWVFCFWTFFKKHYD